MLSGVPNVDICHIVLRTLSLIGHKVDKELCKDVSQHVIHQIMAHGWWPVDSSVNYIFHYLDQHNQLKAGYELFCVLPNDSILNLDSVYFMMSVFGYKNDTKAALQVYARNNNNFSSTLIKPEILYEKFLNQCSNPEGTQPAIDFIEAMTPLWKPLNNKLYKCITRTFGRLGRLDLVLQYWYQYKAEISDTKPRPDVLSYLSTLRAIEATKKQARDARKYIVLLEKRRDSGMLDQVDSFLNDISARLSYGWEEWEADV